MTGQRRAAGLTFALTLLLGPLGIHSAAATPSIRVTITSGPQGVVASRDATFTFEANEPATFACSLDGSRFAPCESPASYVGLPNGDHLFAVRATDRTGTNSDTAERRFTVRIEEPPGEAPPVGDARPDTVGFHGPFKLTRQLLQRSPRIKRIRPMPRDTVDHEVVGQPADCSLGACLPPLLEVPGIESLLGRRTPRPAFEPWEISTKSNDPNIAVSKTHVAVTAYNTIRFYTKSGDPVNEDKFGNPLLFPLPTAELFRPLWDTSITPDSQVINSFLNLPPGSPCDVDNPFPADGNTFCLNDWYDTRVVFDEYRKRFWIAAVARNPKWKLKESTPQQHASRRNKIVVAVSLTEDPRDGFYLYWWNASIDDGACNEIGSSSADVEICGPFNTYRPGDAADYPSLAITKHFLVQTIAVDHFDPWAPDFPDGAKTAGYALVNVWSADALAGAGCTSQCSWSYWNFNYPGTNSKVAGIVQPVHQHKGGEVNSAQRSFLVGTSGGDRLWVWAFSRQEQPFAPPLRGAPVNVATFAGGADAPQKPSSPVTNPNFFRFGNVGSLVTKAVMRNESLFATWQDCKTWSGQSDCSTSIRLVKVFNPGSMIDQFKSNSGFLGTPILDRTFGLRNKFDDGPSDVVFYGNPGVEANQVSDIVLVYNRSGTTVFPEARYSLWKGDEADIRPSALMHAGAFPCAGNAAADGLKGVCNMDTAGIAVDPWDDKGVWMAHAYAYKSGDTGKIKFAVGKVLGTTQPDLAPEVLNVKLAKVLAGGSLPLSVRVTNQGDSASPASRLRLSLLPSRRSSGAAPSARGRAAKRRVRLGTLRVPRLGPGASRTLRARVRIPRGARPGRYRIQATSLKRAGKREYSGANNRIRSRTIRILR